MGERSLAVKLYEIPLEAMDIEQQLVENIGELTPELEQRIAEFLKAGKEKIEAAAVVVKSIESDADVCEAEAKRLSERAAGLRKSADHLKGLVLFAVDSAFDGKLKTAKYTIWGQTSAASVSFELAPEADVYLLATQEPWCVRMRDPELNKVALKEAHAAGKTLPDSVIAAERTGTRFLRIK